MVYSTPTWLIQQSYKVSISLDKNTTFLVKTVQHCCDLERWSKSLKVKWAGKAQWVVPSCKVWHHIYAVWVNPNVKVFDKPRHLINNNKKVSYLPSIHTKVTQIILCTILSTYVATIQSLIYRQQEPKTHIAIYISDTPVTLKQGQGHQTLNDNADPKQYYKHATFERSCFNSGREKANINFFFQMRNYLNYLPWIWAFIKKAIFVIYLTYWTVPWSLKCC